MADKQGTRAAHRDWWVALGLFVSALSAAVSSYAGLHALALASGWHPWAAPLFPLAVDCLALTAVRIWLARSTGSAHTRRVARTAAIAAILLSVVGNATWHLVAAGLVCVTWVIVVLVGAVPPVTMALVVHLAVLRTQDDEDGKGALDCVPVLPGDVPRTGPELARTTSTVLGFEGTGSGVRGPLPRTDAWSRSERRYATEDELLVAARTAEAEYRRQFGRPITRDTLRRELRVSGQRATEVLRRLKEERSPPSDGGQQSIPQQTGP